MGKKRFGIVDFSGCRLIGALSESGIAESPSEKGIRSLGARTCAANLSMRCFWGLGKKAAS